VPELLHLKRKRVYRAQDLADGGQVRSAGGGSANRRAARLADGDLLPNDLDAFFLVIAQGGMVRRA